MEGIDASRLVLKLGLGLSFRQSATGVEFDPNSQLSTLHITKGNATDDRHSRRPVPFVEDTNDLRRLQILNQVMYPANTASQRIVIDGGSVRAKFPNNTTLLTGNRRIAEERVFWSWRREREAEVRHNRGPDSGTRELP